MRKETRRILFISRAYGEGAGGMERLSFELIQSFSAHGLSVRPIVYETKPGKSLLTTRLQSIFFVLTILPRALVASRHADIVHLGDPVLSLVGWCIARVRKIPVAVTVHGVDVSYTNPIYKLYLQLFFHTFAAYIPISTFAKNLLEQHSVRGTISVIPPGIHDNLYKPSCTKHDLSKLLHYDISKSIVLSTTGRLVKRKGHEWFVRNVVPRLPKNMLYVIAGSGPEYDSISHAIISLDLIDKVFMLGRVSKDDQKTLVNTVDAFIQPNIAVAGDVEGFGIAPLEAALCDRAVFAANIDGIPSAIHHGKNGTLLESGNANAWVQALTQPMPNLKAREYTLSAFGWDRVVDEYKRVFSLLA